MAYGFVMRCYNLPVDLDDTICHCYRVSLRKLVNFTRRERPDRASQLSNCLDAGTGCGWCIPVLERIHRRVLEGRRFEADQPIDWLPQTPEQYAEARKAYRQADGKNTFQTP